MDETFARFLKASLTAAAVAATLAATLALAPPAQAGRYVVYSCRTPSGTPASTEGWSPSIPRPGSAETYALNTCPQGGALIAALGDQVSHGAGDFATWTFSAPAGDTIAGATIWRAGDAPGGGNAVASYESWLAGPANADAFDECVFTLACTAHGSLGTPLAAANRVVAPGGSPAGTHLYADAACAAFVPEAECKPGAGDANGYAAAVYVYAAQITLEQTAGPAVSNVSGELATAAAVKGTSGVSFSASDPSSGVWQAVLSVDGHVTHTSALDEAAGHCRDVGHSENGLPAFLYLQPCALSLDAEVGLDTTALTNGPHQVLVQVEDAAGNLATVLERTVDVENPTCGDGSASGAAGRLDVAWRGSRGPALTSAWGARQTVVGRLTGPHGAPIAGAPVSVSWASSSGGVSAAVPAASHTVAGGRFTARVSTTAPSRTLCLIYRPPSGASPLIASLALRTRAGLALHVSPHTTSVGHTIHFSGRLLSGPVPAGGKALVLEARSPGGRWIEFDVIHTGSRGRFRARYTFRFEGPASYQFRALSEAEADYPYATGASNVVGVFER